MDKKWSCSACEYKSGRRSNMERHIDRKHGNYGMPVPTEFQNSDLSHQASRDYSYDYYPHPQQDWRRKERNNILEKKKADSFISSYKFEDKKLGIYKKYLEAIKLSPSEERNLIVEDLMLQMHRASSNPSQFWLDPLKIMTSAKITYPLRSDSPTWWQEIGKQMESKNFNNSESRAKSGSAVKANASKDFHKRKLEVALQKILDWKKEREICEQLIREFGDNANTRKTDKSNLAAQ